MTGIFVFHQNLQKLYTFSIESTYEKQRTEYKKKEVTHISRQVSQDEMLQIFTSFVETAQIATVSNPISSNPNGDMQAELVTLFKPNVSAV